MHTIDKIHNRLYNQMYNRLYFGGAVMKNNLFGEKVSYEHFAPPYVLIALMSRFVNLGTRWHCLQGYFLGYYAN